MPRIAQPITANHLFTVSKVRLYTQAGAPTDVFAAQRDDNQEIIGNFSKGYGLVQNADAVDAVESAFSAHGDGLADFDRKVCVLRGGSALSVVYDFKNHQITVPRVNDILGLRLTLLNSFDGSSPLAFEVGYLRLVCLNGMKAVVRELALTKKHYGTIDLAFIRAKLAEAVSKAKTAAELYAAMAAITITQLEGENIILNMAADGTFSARVAVGILEVWRKPSYAQDNARNVYNLFNACTQYITRNVEEKSFEMARRVNGTVAASFARVTSKPEELGRLVLLPPSK